MPLVTTNEMLKKAQAGHYAVGAFNVENMEMVMAVIKAAEEMNSPVIMQTTPSTVKYAGLDYYLAMVRTAAERASVPVAIHLDHGSSFELAMQALRTGYTSIMIDGSHGSFEENVALTRRVADACLPSQISGAEVCCDVTVEAADGIRKTLSCPDAELTRQGIDEGDAVLWDGTALRKA